jgi:hypothetical protein
MIGQKEYWKHLDTGRVYVIESTLYGQMIGSCGPFDADNLPPLETCRCGKDQMIWIETTMDEGKLRRINPLAAKAKPAGLKII